MPTPHTDKQIQKAYSVARAIARRFAATHYIDYLDIDDYVQEGVLGWLEGRNIYHAIVDAFRAAAPIDKVAYKSGVQIPKMVHYGVRVPDFIAETMSYDPVDSISDVIDSRDLPDRVLDAIQQLPEKMQFCVLGSYYYGLTLAEIAELLEVNIRFVSEWRKEGVETLRKYFKEKENTSVV